jgi:hypothetical protein
MPVRVTALAATAVPGQGDLRRRQRAYQAFTKQMSRQRYRYFQQTRNARLRTIFVRKQKAQQKALLRALRRCR